jgi:hypothetical protein
MQDSPFVFRLISLSVKKNNDAAYDKKSETSSSSSKNKLSLSKFENMDEGKDVVIWASNERINIEYFAFAGLLGK